MTVAKHSTIWLNPGLLPIQFGFCPSERAWKKQMKAFKCSHLPYPDTHARVTILDSKQGQEPTCCVVTLRDDIDYREPQVAVSLLAHEAVHVWQEAVLVMKEEAPSAEFEAYSVQFILQSLLAAYEETRGAAWLSRKRRK